jgi:hypothetical protein
LKGSNRLPRGRQQLASPLPGRQRRSCIPSAVARHSSVSATQCLSIFLQPSHSAPTLERSRVYFLPPSFLALSSNGKRSLATTGSFHRFPVFRSDDRARVLRRVSQTSARARRHPPAYCCGDTKPRSCCCWAHHPQENQKINLRKMPKKPLKPKFVQQNQPHPSPPPPPTHSRQISSPTMMQLDKLDMSDPKTVTAVVAIGALGGAGRPPTLNRSSTPQLESARIQPFLRPANEVS